MNVIVKNITQTTLELNEAEALWLKVLMQNPLNGQEYGAEDRIDEINRRNLFNALSEGV